MVKSTAAPPEDSGSISSTYRAAHNGLQFQYLQGSSQRSAVPVSRDPSTHTDTHAGKTPRYTK